MNENHIPTRGILSERVKRRAKQRNIKPDARQGAMLDRKALAVSSIVPERAMIQWWKGVGSCYAVGTTCKKEPEAPAHRPREEEEEEEEKGPRFIPDAGGRSILLEKR